MSHFEHFLVTSPKRPFGVCFYQSMRLCPPRGKYRCCTGTQDFFYVAYSSRTGFVQSMAVGNLVVAEKRQPEPKWPFWLRVSEEKKTPFKKFIPILLRRRREIFWHVSIITGFPSKKFYLGNPLIIDVNPFS